MINYDTWVVGAWIDRSVETRRSVIEFRDRVIAAGNKKHASHTGIVHVIAKHMRNSMEHAVRTNFHVHEPDLAKAVLGSVDWHAIAENTWKSARLRMITDLFDQRRSLYNGDQAFRIRGLAY